MLTLCLMLLVTYYALKLCWHNRPGPTQMAHVISVINYIRCSSCAPSHSKDHNDKYFKMNVNVTVKVLLQL